MLAPRGNGWPRFEYLNKKKKKKKNFLKAGQKNRHFSIGLEAKIFENGLKIREY